MIIGHFGIGVPHMIISHFHNVTKFNAKVFVKCLDMNYFIHLLNMMRCMRGEPQGVGQGYFRAEHCKSQVMVTQKVKSQTIHHTVIKHDGVHEGCKWHTPLGVV